MIVLFNVGIFLLFVFFFFFNDTATTEIYTLSLHDALPISDKPGAGWSARPRPATPPYPSRGTAPGLSDLSVALPSLRLLLGFRCFLKFLRDYGPLALYLIPRLAVDRVGRP